MEFEPLYCGKYDKDNHITFVPSNPNGAVIIMKEEGGDDDCRKSSEDRRSCK